MKWPLVSLGHALASADVFVDGDWVESKDQDPEGDVRLIQLADVGDGQYVDKSERYLTAAKARELKCTFLETGDVLVARMPDPLGRACIFPGDPMPAVTVVDVCIIRPNGNGPDSRWLVHWFNSSDARNQIAAYATGTTRSRISRGNLSKLKLAIPPLAEQRRIAAILDKADALRVKRRAALDQLDTLTQSIFLDMFGDPASNPFHWTR
jgi:type I restriction enzyme S subunit